jgi:hypothetical protein
MRLCIGVISPRLAFTPLMLLAYQSQLIDFDMCFIAANPQRSEKVVTKAP